MGCTVVDGVADFSPEFSKSGATLRISLLPVIQVLGNLLEVFAVLQFRILLGCSPHLGILALASSCGSGCCIPIGASFSFS